MYRFVMIQGNADRRPDLDAARAVVLDDHREAVSATLSAADAVATALDSPATDGTAVATTLEATLRDRDLLPALLAALDDAVAAAGYEFAANPVPAPPYLAVTSRGPVLRATVDGGRIVVAVAAFEVKRDPARYVRGHEDLAEALSVEFRPAQKNTNHE